MKKYVKCIDDFTGSTITVDLNTDVLPVVSVDLYSREDMLYDFEEDISASELDPAIMKLATPYVQETVEEVLPGVKITPTKVYHPSYYNFEVDTLDFTLSVPAVTYNALKEQTVANPEFAAFLRENYKSYDGFWSHMADNLQDFNKQDVWKQVCQVIMFYVPDSTIKDNNYNFEQDLSEYLFDNYTYIDLYDTEDDLI